MKRSQELYKQICDAAGQESLSDADINKIVLFLQRRLRQIQIVGRQADHHWCTKDAQKKFLGDVYFGTW